MPVGNIILNFEFIVTSRQRDELFLPFSFSLFKILKLSEHRPNLQASYFRSHAIIYDRSILKCRNSSSQSYAKLSKNQIRIILPTIKLQQPGDKNIKTLHSMMVTDFT